MAAEFVQIAVHKKSTELAVRKSNGHLRRIAQYKALYEEGAKENKTLTRKLAALTGHADTLAESEEITDS